MIQLLLLFSLIFSSAVFSSTVNNDKISSLFTVDFNTKKQTLGASVFYDFDYPIDYFPENVLNPFGIISVQDNDLFLGGGVKYLFDDNSHDAIQFEFSRSIDNSVISIGIEKEILKYFSLYSKTTYFFDSNRLIGFGFKFYPFDYFKNETNNLKLNDVSIESDNRLLEPKLNYRDNNCDYNYIVQKGDWIYSISRKINVSVKTIMENNQSVLKNVDLIYPGDVLCIRY